MTENQALEIALSVLREKIEETYERFLISKSETNIPRFTLHAMQLLKQDDKEKFWDVIIKDYRSLFNDEMELDGPNVMNIAGIIYALEKNKKNIFKLSEKMPDIVKTIFDKFKAAGLKKYANEKAVKTLLESVY